MDPSNPQNSYNMAYQSGNIPRGYGTPNAPDHDMSTAAHMRMPVYEQTHPPHAQSLVPHGQSTPQHPQQQQLYNQYMRRQQQHVQSGQHHSVHKSQPTTAQFGPSPQHPQHPQHPQQPYPSQAVPIPGPKPKDVPPKIALAPNLPPMHTKMLQTYIDRDRAYQDILDKQVERHRLLAYEKKAIIEQSHAEKRTVKQPGAIPFGIGYNGLGNGITGPPIWKPEIGGHPPILYPTERKRPNKRIREFKFPKTEIEQLASKDEMLVPIRIEVDAEGYKLRDTFTWNMNETLIKPLTFAEILCDDLHIPPHPHIAPAVARQIEEQIQDFMHHPQNNSSQKVDEDSERDFAIRDENGNLISGYALSEQDLDQGKEQRQVIRHEELRILIKLDILVGNRSLTDQFEWDINCPKNVPEEFAEVLANELGLGGEFKTAIAHSIREQVHIYTKSLILIGHGFDGAPVIDDDLKGAFLPPINSCIREEEAVESFTPVLLDLEPLEIEKLERDREREGRRRRRQTRGRRGIILPDREAPKTHRTLLLPAPPPTDPNAVLDEDGIPITATLDSYSGYPPPSGNRDASSLVGRRSGRLRTQVVEVARGASTTFVASGSASPGHMGLHSAGAGGVSGLGVRDIYATPTKLNRGRPDLIAQTWTCQNCGAESTPMTRNGPTGRKTLCNACGIFLQKNGRMRPIAERMQTVNTNSSLAFETLSTPPTTPSPYTNSPHSVPFVQQQPQQPQQLQQLQQLQPPQQPHYQHQQEQQQQLPPPQHQQENQEQKQRQQEQQEQQEQLQQQQQQGQIPSLTPSSSPYKTQQLSIDQNLDSSNKTDVESSIDQISTSVASSTTESVPGSPAPLPEWTVNEKAALQERYPSDRFDIIQRNSEWKIKCYDCPGKLFHTGPGETLENFAVHLKNKAHRNNVEARTGLIGPM